MKLKYSSAIPLLVVSTERDEPAVRAGFYSKYVIMKTDTTNIPRLRFSEPRYNLPGRKGLATAEDRFTISFARSYLMQAKTIHNGSIHTTLVSAREIPVNGYGIADLHVVAWDSIKEEVFPDIESFVKVVRPCTRAFECKLKDWRRAMSQAARYRFFANQAIAVLPDNTCKQALAYIDTFRKIRVGLWSFCPETGQIMAYYTPRPVIPKSEKYYLHAINCVNSATKQALPIR